MKVLRFIAVVMLVCLININAWAGIVDAYGRRSTGTGFGKGVESSMEPFVVPKGGGKIVSAEITCESFEIRKEGQDTPFLFFEDTEEAIHCKLPAGGYTLYPALSQGQDVSEVILKLRTK